MSFLVIFMKFLYSFEFLQKKRTKSKACRPQKAPSGVIPEGAFCMYSIFKFFDV